MDQKKYKTRRELRCIQTIIDELGRQSSSEPRAHSHQPIRHAEEIQSRSGAEGAGTPDPHTAMHLMSIFGNFEFTCLRVTHCGAAISTAVCSGPPWTATGRTHAAHPAPGLSFPAAGIGRRAPRPIPTISHASTVHMPDMINCQYHDSRSSRRLRPRLAINTPS